MTKKRKSEIGLSVQDIENLKDSQEVGGHGDGEAVLLHLPPKGKRQKLATIPANNVLQVHNPNVPPPFPASSKPTSEPSSQVSCSELNELGVSPLLVSLTSSNNETTSVNQIFQSTCSPNLEIKKKSSSSSSSSSPDYFSVLTDEVIILIFKWLPKSVLATKCTRVNKRWNRIALDETLWKRLDLGYKTLSQEALGSALSRGTQVLKMNRANIITQPNTSNLISYNFTAKLQILDLSMATINLTSLETLFKATRYLKKLSLELVPINPTICQYISQNKDLSIINCAMTTGFTPQGIQAMFTPLKKLKELNLAWTELDEPELDSFCKVLHGGESLEKLNLSGCRDLLSDDHVSILAAKCPNLVEMDFSDCTNLANISVDVLAANCSKLEVLSANRCYGIIPSSYLVLDGCPSMVYLNAMGIMKDEALEELTQRLKAIEINKHHFSTIARPTVGVKRTSIWNLRMRD